MDSPLIEVIKLFTRLGFTAFGGPAAHIALIEDEVVTRRKWLDRRHFLDLVAAVNFIPGPNSTELAIHLGLIRAGYAGLIAAGVCFITPAVLIILPLAWMYVTYGANPSAQPALAGINAVVVGVIANALVRFARSSVGSIFLIGVAIGSVALTLGIERGLHQQPEVYVLLAAGLAGWFRVRWRQIGIVPLLLVPATLPTAATMVAGATVSGLCLFFLKIGATLFGSGYVLVSYLQSGLVEQNHWLTQRQLLDAISVGQFTPGPLLTTATFVGYLIGHDHFSFGALSGLIGALLATVCIFLPSFVLVALGAPLLDRLRKNPGARSALDAMNASVVALLAITTVHLAVKALNDPIWAVLAIATLAILLWKNINATWLILLGAACGLIRTAF